MGRKRTEFQEGLFDRWEGERVAPAPFDPLREPQVEMPVSDEGVKDPNGTPHYTNHRTRLRARFMAAGEGALPDYELLELVLFRAIPRRDVKPLAKRLLDAFGDFNHALAASPQRLKQVPGVGEAVIHELKIVEAAAQRMARAKVLEKPLISSWEDLTKYCRIRMAHLDREEFRLLFLDRKNVLIADELAQRGTINHVPVYPREVARRALELDASAVILVHNHPTGDAGPSSADIAVTKQIEAALEALEIGMYDHLIVGKGQEFSFRSAGLL